MLIDATQKIADPPISLPKREFMERARAIWDELKLPPITAREPWHGYSLGDWDAAWDSFAERAVKGHWELTGRESFARRRSGLTPETPVKSVKDR
jgi:4-hydroxy-3-polyprenylbenzoate decarboxylase